MLTHFRTLIVLFLSGVTIITSCYNLIRFFFNFSDFKAKSLLGLLLMFITFFLKMLFKFQILFKKYLLFLCRSEIGSMYVIYWGIRFLNIFISKLKNIIRVHCLKHDEKLNKYRRHSQLFFFRLHSRLWKNISTTNNMNVIWKDVGKNNRLK